MGTWDFIQGGASEKLTGCEDNFTRLRWFAINTFLMFSLKMKDIWTYKMKRFDKWREIICVKKELIYLSLET